MNTLKLMDGLNRHIDYLRLSVTDRCDFRCVYCMAPEMKFLPKHQLLSSEEIIRVVRLFVEMGIKKVRLTGGEPLIRQGVVKLCRQIAVLPGLNELTMTTNGSHLALWANELAGGGVKRINISLDSLCQNTFKVMTRVGNLQSVLAGINAARQAGFASIKLNSVILKGINDHEVLSLVDFAVDHGIDISFIEEMPIGRVGRSRQEDYYSSDEVFQQIIQRYRLIETVEQTGGPAKYLRILDYPLTRIGLISPHSHNFCSSCNRVRVTADGRLLLCLGHENSLDLCNLLRDSSVTDSQIQDAIRIALWRKPEKHELYTYDEEFRPVRFMSAVGG